MAKLDATGSAILFSSYFGGFESEYGRAIALGADGSVYFAGATLSEDFPVLASLQPPGRANGDGFLVSYDPVSNLVIYATYFGGAGWDWISGLAVDAAGNAHVVGTTESSDFPVLSPVQAELMGETDAFLAQISPKTTFGIMVEAGEHGAISPSGVDGKVTVLRGERGPSSSLPMPVIM